MLVIPARKACCRLLLFTIALLAISAVSTDGRAACNASALRGANLSGAEVNGSKLPGRLNYDYIYPTLADLTYFQQIGATAIRLPVRWERLQPTILGALSPTEIGYIRATLSAASALDLCVILDVHNYGAYRGNAIGSANVPERAFADLWLRLHAAFPDPKHLAFGLMNEPSKLSIAAWARIAQQTVTQLRLKGSRHLILVPGGRWSGAHDWFLVSGGISNADAFSGFQDSARNFVIEMHQYVDSDYSGSHYSDCIAPDRLRAILGKVDAWARANKMKLFLGEFGVAATPACLADLDAMLASMNDHSIWRGWTYWAAGRWWGSYPFSIQPNNGVAAAQTAVLRKYLVSPPARLIITR